MTIYTPIIALRAILLVSILWLPGYSQVFPKPANFEDVPVYRLQLAIETANVGDAGTDDRVFVVFNSQMKGYYLDVAKDDRERNHLNTYDIIDPTIKTIRDLNLFTLTKQGTDGWALKDLKILVNGQVIFQNLLGAKWIDGNDGHSPTLSYNANELRANSSWGYYDRHVHVPALVIPVNELRLMIESIVGNQIRYISDRTVNWGSRSGINTIWGEAVEFSFKNQNRLSVDLDLQVAHWGPNSELDVDFDIVVNCESNKVTLSLENFKARADFLNLIPVKRIKENLLKNLNRTYSNVPICNVHFEQNGTLKLL
jgi:hypothetical protein